MFLFMFYLLVFTKIARSKFSRMRGLKGKNFDENNNNNNNNNPVNVQKSSSANSIFSKIDSLFNEQHNNESILSIPKLLTDLTDRVSPSISPTSSPCGPSRETSPRPDDDRRDKKKRDCIEDNQQSKDLHHTSSSPDARSRPALLARKDRSAKIVVKVDIDSDNAPKRYPRGASKERDGNRIVRDDDRDDDEDNTNNNTNNNNHSQNSSKSPERERSSLTNSTNSTSSSKSLDLHLSRTNLSNLKRV
jgi:hypothetical protein